MAYMGVTPVKPHMILQYESIVLVTDNPNAIPKDVSRGNVNVGT